MDRLNWEHGILMYSEVRLELFHSILEFGLDLFNWESGIWMGFLREPPTPTAGHKKWTGSIERLEFWRLTMSVWSYYGQLWNLHWICLIESWIWKGFLREPPTPTAGHKKWTGSIESLEFWRLPMSVWSYCCQFLHLEWICSIERIEFGRDS